MLFPTQHPTNFPPYQMQANPMQRMTGNMMFPGQRPAAPPTSSNPMQNIIGRFLQPQNVQQAAALPTRAAGGLSNTLNNVQQVLKIVQSTAPVVQQYGPMVKNIPVMFKMLKAFKDTDDEPNESIASPKEQDNKNTKDESGSDPKQTKSTVLKTNDGQSKPKLFI